MCSTKRRLLQQYHVQPVVRFAETDTLSTLSYWRDASGGYLRAVSQNLPGCFSAQIAPSADTAHRRANGRFIRNRSFAIVY